MKAKKQAVAPWTGKRIKSLIKTARKAVKLKSKPGTRKKELDAVGQQCRDQDVVWQQYRDQVISEFQDDTEAKEKWLEQAKEKWLEEAEIEWEDTKDEWLEQAEEQWEEIAEERWEEAMESLIEGIVEKRIVERLLEDADADLREAEREEHLGDKKLAREVVKVRAKRYKYKGKARG